MNLETSLAVYAIFWWVVLFSVLPMGVVSHAEAGVTPPGGGDPASPVEPKLKRKFLTTTWVSAVAFAVLWLVIKFGLIKLSGLPATY